MKRLKKHSNEIKQEDVVNEVQEEMDTQEEDEIELIDENTIVYIASVGNFSPQLVFTKKENVEKYLKLETNKILDTYFEQSKMIFKVSASVWESNLAEAMSIFRGRNLRKDQVRLVTRKKVNVSDLEDQNIYKAFYQSVLEEEEKFENTYV